MDLVKHTADFEGTEEGKFHKATMFRTNALLLGINCLEPGQEQAPHAHADQDKFYYVISGRGRFWLGADRVTASEGEVVWVPAGVDHGVTNDGDRRLTLLVGIAPAP